MERIETIIDIERSLTLGYNELARDKMRVAKDTGETLPNKEFSVNWVVAPNFQTRHSHEAADRHAARSSDEALSSNMHLQPTLSSTMRIRLCPISVAIHTLSNPQLATHGGSHAPLKMDKIPRTSRYSAEDSGFVFDAVEREPLRD